MADSYHNTARIGFLLFDYFPFGGLQRDCLKVAQLCARRGSQVTLFTRTWQGDHPQGISLELFGRHGWTNLSRNRRWIATLKRELPKRGLHGIVGFNKLPGLDFYYGSDPCFVAKQTRLRSPLYRWLPRFRHFARLEREVFHADLSTKILLLTDLEIPVYQSIYGTARDRFHLLPPGIERYAFDAKVKDDTRSRVRWEQGWEDDEHLALFVGSGFRVKGLDRAIHSLSRLPEDVKRRTRLVVIGQNRPEPYQLQAMCQGVTDRIHFLGGRSDVRDFQMAADLQFHPAYSESAGMVLLEALTVGLPVLTTDTCGYADHIRRAGAGVVLPSPFSQDQCDAELARMLTAPERAAWSAQGLRYAAEEDLYSCHERAADIILEGVARKRGL